MNRNAIRRSLVGAAVAGALCALGGQANAAVLYAGTFDPNTFSGSYQIKVDNDCLTTDGWKYNYAVAFNPGDGLCTVSLESAVAAVDWTSPTYNGSLTFAPPALSANGPIYGIMVVNNALDSLDTAMIPFVSASPSTTDSWWLQFSSGYPFIINVTEFVCDFAVGPQVGCGGPPKGVYLYHAPVEGSRTLLDSAVYTGIQEIPEPGTLGLALGALASGWVVRRRKRPAA